MRGMYKARAFLCVILLCVGVMPQWTCTSADMAVDAMGGCEARMGPMVRFAASQMDCCQVSAPVAPAMGPRASEPLHRPDVAFSDTLFTSLSVHEAPKIPPYIVPRSRHAAPLDPASPLILRI